MREMVTLKQFGRKRIGNMKSIILLFMRERERERDRQIHRQTLAHHEKDDSLYRKKSECDGRE